MPDCSRFTDEPRTVLPLHESEFVRRERQLIDALAEYGVLPTDHSPLARLPSEHEPGACFSPGG